MEEENKNNNQEEEFTDDELDNFYQDLDDDILNYQESDFLLDYWEKQIKKKQGANNIVTGVVGGGKSSLCVRAAEKWYERRFGEKFPVKHICNTIEDAILLAKKVKRKGELIIIEELSVHAGSRASMSTANKVFNMFLDICRVKQLIILGNAPHLTFVDKHVQSMMHVWINCYKVDFRKKITLAKAYWLQTSPFKAEPYKHKFVNKDGDEIDFCYMKKPSDDLWKEYEGMKDYSNDEIFDMIILKLRNDKEKKMKELGAKTLPNRQEEAYSLSLQGYNSKDGGEKMGISSRGFNKLLKEAKERLQTAEYTKEFEKLQGKAQ